MCKSAALTAALAHWRWIHWHEWQAWDVCHRSLLHTAERGQQGGCEVQGLQGVLSRSWLVRSAAVCASQPAGAGLLHLIKTDLMIETETLFITVDFHTRQDSRIFHLRAFICRNEERVPIFKLNLPSFSVVKWFSLFFFSSFFLGKFYFHPAQIGDVSLSSLHVNVCSYHIVTQLGWKAQVNLYSVPTQQMSDAFTAIVYGFRYLCSQKRQFPESRWWEGRMGWSHD